MKTTTAIGFAQGSSDSFAKRDYDDTPPSQLRGKAQIKNYKLGYKQGYFHGVSSDLTGLDLNAIAREVAKATKSVKEAIPKAQQMVTAVKDATPQIKETLARTQATLARTQETVSSIKSTGEWIKKNWYWLALGLGGSIAAIVVAVKVIRKPKTA